MQCYKPSISSLNFLQKKTSHNIVPWWDNECFLVKETRRLAIKEYKNNPNTENLIRANNAITRAKRIFKEKKKKSFTEFCNNLNPNTDIKQIWRTVKIFKNSFKPPTYKPNNINCTEEILDHLAPAWVNLDPSFNQPEEFDPILSPSFTMEELLSVLQRTKMTSPGPDSVIYMQIKHLPLQMKLILLDIINSIKSGEDVPADWNIVHILPILKPDKNPDAVKSYRPIALSSCLLKTAEQLLKLRLDWWLEANDILPVGQFGYRKGKSTLTCLILH